MAKPIGDMPDLQPAHHARNWVAQPPHNQEMLGRDRRKLEQGSSSHQLPQQGTQPEINGKETGSSQKGLTKGLSRMIAKGSRTVLRGEGGSNAFNLPDKTIFNLTEE
jgi:hypothetical protein